MKKIISVVLAATLILSVLFSIPISVGAETASSASSEYFDNPEYYTHVDFSEEYYTNNGVGINKAYNYAQIVDDPDTTSGHGKAAKFNKISTAYDGTVNLNRKFPNLVRIADLSGKTAFKVIEGETYKVQWSLKRAVTQGSAFNIGIFITNDNDLNFYNADKLADTIDRTQKYVSAATTSYWEDWYVVEFTAKKSGTLAMMMSKSTAATSGVEIYVDDIIVSRTVNYTHVDFSEEYYANQTGDGTNYSYNYAQIVDDPDTESGQGKVAKFTMISIAYSSGSASINHTYPHVVRIADLGGKTAFKVIAGKTYKVQFSLKKPVTQGSAFNVSFFITNDTNLIFDANKIAGTTPRYNCYVTEATTDYWANWYSVEFTAATSGTLAMMLSKGSSPKVDNVEVYVDDITVGEITSVTCHNNNGSDDTTASVSTGTTFDKITAPTLAGAEFKGWYLDKKLTIPATGRVADTKEIWAKWASVAENFDTIDSLAEGMVRNTDGSFSLVPNNGYENTTAASTSLEKYNWHPTLQLYNADGSEFKTVSGHNYQLTFKYLAEDPSKLTNNSYIGINYAKSDTTSVSNNAYTYKAVQYSYYQNGTQINSGWIPYNIEFTGQDNLGVWLKFQGMTTTAYIDDVKIVDLTAQKKITAADGTVLASGYVGDSAELTETDANGDTNRLYWSETENGAEYVGNDVILDNVTLYPVCSQIAVTNTTVTGGDKAKLNAKIRFENIGLTATENGVSVDNITVNGTRYIVKEIGVMVAPTAALNGKKLTLDNYAAVGGQLVNNSDVKYAVAADGVLTVIPQIAVADVNTDYTVVAYVKYASYGKIMYSKTRSGIDTTYAGAADLEAVESYTAKPSDTTYTLVENSEFNDDTVNVYDKWNNYGAPTENNGVTTYASSASVAVKDKNLELITVKNTDTSIQRGRIRTKQYFTHGYIEVKAKFADLDDIEGAIWLNSAGIDESLLTVKPTETDTYIKPEIDIVEFTSKSSEYITIHSWEIGAPTSSKMTRISTEDYSKSDSFTIKDRAIELDLSQTHIYGFERTSDVMRFYIDGILAFEVTKEQLKGKANRTDSEIQALFDNPTYLIVGASFAPDGKDVGTTATSYIDYVRIYE